MNGGIPWREHRWLWLVPLLAFAANTGLLSMYRAVYAGRVVQLEEQSQREEKELEKLQGTRQALEDRARQVEENQGGMEELYATRLSTQRHRLTSVIREVKDLVARAGLKYQGISYPEEKIERFTLVKKSMVFQVTGDYLSLRRFINFLELSDSFLILEKISMNETGGENHILRVNLHISTLFANEESQLAVSSLPGPEVDS